MISVRKNIFKAKTFSKNYNLKELLESRNNYQNNFQVINVVGTNGKGSVVNYLSHSLQKKYKKVGEFISPAFLNHNERIKINNVPISDHDLKRLLKKNSSDIKKFKLTFFEIWVLISIEYFNENSIDIAIIEAGIGGKKDSTSVFKNQLLTCLTSISIDHTELLGKTLEEIATQKIEIANKNLPIITTKTNFDLLTKYKGWNITTTNSDSDYEIENRNLAEEVLKFLNIEFDLKTIPLPLGRKTKFKNFIIDGAHNIDGIKKLLNNLDKSVKYKILFASSSKKDHTSILNYINDQGFDLYIAKYKHPNAWNIKNINIGNKIMNWKNFLKKHSENNIIILGSLYFVPLVYEYLMKGKI